MQAVLAVLSAPLILSAGTQSVAPPEGVPGPDIVVVGRPPRCEPLVSDPLDQVTARAPRDQWYFTVPDGEGGYRFIEGGTDPDAPPPPGEFTSPGSWRRAGRGMGSFTFRQPDDGTPLCIGKKRHSPAGEVQLQQQLPPDDYRCKSVRLTMFAAARDARALIWLNGYGRPEMIEFGGDREWTPISIEWSPVSYRASWLGFGVILRSGDVWMYDAELTVIDADELSDDQLRNEAQCREDWERRRQREIWQPGVVAADDRNNGT
ncbi:hypothetical protein [Aurantiacibacter spongiae]|uniref:Uncharacterized protein n=1 Tax=Aurantiacibacter spongiae TaxID=2488860 RepID=A0A3N5DKC8_9SPHN|nr:hypothetical protein [Aurantiacibacter spongiae]RPF72162.1 hypothetical protein EG799_11420 [Aurantiacibacter spongiae]